MTVQWGIVSRAELVLFESSDDPERFPHVKDLRPGEVAVAANEAILYGSKQQMLAMAHQIITRWADEATAKPATARLEQQDSPTT